MKWDALYNRAYTPYSKQPRACIVLGKSGLYYAGVRVENVSFPITVPATQAAVCHCLSEGDTPVKLIAKDRNLEQLDFWLKEFDIELIVTDDISVITCSSKVLEISEKETLPMLKQLLASAVTPNSDFPVSALLFADNKAITGVNIEVSDWTKGLCGERVAICKALAMGINSFTKMAVHTLKGEVSSPCGACRQVLVQHLPQQPIDMYHADGTLSRHQVPDLLPFSFSSSSLDAK
tara:strand:+ start:3458 stop:4162 length:705 start_codon:yes stop_codon:yes gene_type:complete